MHQAGLWLCLCICLLLNSLDVSVHVYCAPRLNEQRSIFVSVAQQYSGPNLGNVVLNAKIITVVTEFLWTPSVLAVEIFSGRHSAVSTT